MLTKDEILSLIRQHRTEMYERFSIARIGLFGSYARNQAVASSDIDILVEFERPTFDHYMDAKSYLEDLLQAPVDLVISDTLKPRLKPYIESEVIYA